MTAKKAKPKTRSHTTSSTHGNTRVTITHSGGTTTTTHSTKHGQHRTVVTVVKHRGKVISTSTRKYVVAKHHAHKAAAKGGAKKKRGAPGDCLLDGYWVTGGNDWLATCVPVALANSCLITTGYRIPDWQILALAGERSIADVLTSLGVGFRAAEGIADGVILGIPGQHAVTVYDGAAVSWGAEASLDGLAVEEAWEVAWR